MAANDVFRPDFKATDDWISRRLFKSDFKPTFAFLFHNLKVDCQIN